MISFRPSPFVDILIAALIKQADLPPDTFFQ